MTGILNTLLEITLYSAVLYVAILLFQKVFRKHISAVMNYAVWALLILRLIIPVTVDSGLHFFIIPDEPKQAAYTAASSYNASPQGYILTAQPITDNTPSETPIKNETNDTVLSNQGQVKPWNIGWQTVLVLIWGAGVLFSFGFVAILWRRLRVKIKRCGTAVPGYVLRLVNRCKSEMGIRTDINVSVQGWLKSPALSVSLKPVLLIPENMLRTMDLKQLEFGIRHELTHYLRRDYLMNILLMALRCVYWFNPVIYLAFRSMQTDMETACDVHITSRLKAAERTRYIRTMIDLGGSGSMQYVLGMGMSKGGKEMEKRVRGIFMRKKTRLPVRIAAALIAGLMLVACFTTACQPMPEKAAVVNKGDNSLESIVEQAEAPSAKYEIPAAWQSNFQKDGSKLAVDVDAEISIPNVNAFPVTTIIPTKFTQQQVDKMVQILFQGETVYNSGGLLTKAELTDRLTEAKAGLEEKKRNPRSSDNSIEDFENVINEIEALIPNAPDKKDDQPASTQLQINEYNEIRLDLKADLGKKENAALTIIIEDPMNQYTCFARFINTDNGGPYDSFDNWNLPADTPLSLKITKDDAIGQAKKLLDDLEITGMDVAQVFPGIIGGAEGSDVSANPQCYMVYFTRTVDGIPTALGTNASGSNSPKDQSAPDYRSPWASESILVCVDDSGIAQFEWMSPVNVTEKATDNAALMSFDRIKEIFDEQMFIKYAYIGDDKLLTKQTYYIENVKLGLARIQSKDNVNEYMLVPVWNFFGSIQDDYDMDAVAIRMKELDPNNIEEHMKYYQDKNGQIISNGSKSFLTINAIDGSLVG